MSVMITSHGDKNPMHSAHKSVGRCHTQQNMVNTSDPAHLLLGIYLLKMSTVRKICETFWNANTPPQKITGILSGSPFQVFQFIVFV